MKVTFNGDLRLYIKGIYLDIHLWDIFWNVFEGSRDPYEIHDNGAGFALCWQGKPEIRIGYENQQKDLVQVMSEGMLIAIPE